MCNHLRRHKPDSYLVAEQDALLFLYCFQTARMCVCVCVCMERGRFKRRRRKERDKAKHNRCSLAVQKNAAILHKMGHYPSTVYHCVVDKSMAMSLMALCYSKHKAHRLPACYGGCSKGALRARVLIARRHVCVCARVGVCVWAVTYVCISVGRKSSCVACLCFLCSHASVQEFLMKTSCHWSIGMNLVYNC